MEKKPINLQQATIETLKPGDQVYLDGKVITIDHSAKKEIVPHFLFWITLTGHKESGESFSISRRLGWNLNKII